MGQISYPREYIIIKTKQNGTNFLLTMGQISSLRWDKFPTVSKYIVSFAHFFSKYGELNDSLRSSLTLLLFKYHVTDVTWHHLAGGRESNLYPFRSVLMISNRFLRITKEKMRIGFENSRKL